MAKLQVGVIYGSRSPEHEVSVITAIQAMQNLDPNKYDITPIYISKDGFWYKGNKDFINPNSYKDLARLVSNLKPLSLTPPKQFSTPSLPFSKTFSSFDIVFPIFHGPYGEDGTIQGLLEMLDIPYVGCSVASSALGMDKILQKNIYRNSGIEQVKYIWFYSSDWSNNASAVLKKLSHLKYPLYIKPSNGGSSIGISKVKTRSELEDAINVACHYDRKIIVEESAEGYKEINISVLGNSGAPLKTSVCEQPVASQEVLTFSDKYESSNAKSAGMASARRLIPAPIKNTTAIEISRLAKSAFEALDCSGIARVDFLVSPDEKNIYLNEINTIPGSLSFYLWEATGLGFPSLLDQLIELGLDRYKSTSKLTRTFPNNLLSKLGETLKGSKLKR